MGHLKVIFLMTYKPFEEFLHNLYKKSFLRPKGEGNMQVVQFPEKIATLSENKSKFNLFEKLSLRLGVDVNKVVLEKDSEEKEKLKRVLQKETMRERTRTIEE